MAVLRRGCVRIPHNHGDRVKVRVIDGREPTIMLRDIMSWEEIEMPKTLSKIVLLRAYVDSFVVIHSFDELDEMVNGKAVQP